MCATASELLEDGASQGGEGAKARPRALHLRVALLKDIAECTRGESMTSSGSEPMEGITFVEPSSGKWYHSVSTLSQERDGEDAAVERSLESQTTPSGFGSGELSTMETNHCQKVKALASAAFSTRDSLTQDLESVGNLRGSVSSLSGSGTLGMLPSDFRQGGLDRPEVTAAWTQDSIQSLPSISDRLADDEDEDEESYHADLHKQGEHAPHPLQSLFPMAAAAEAEAAQEALLHAVSTIGATGGCSSSSSHYPSNSSRKSGSSFPSSGSGCEPHAADSEVDGTSGTSSPTMQAWKPLSPEEFLSSDVQSSLYRCWPQWRHSKRLFGPPRH